LILATHHHQLLINWTRLHLNHIKANKPRLDVSFLSPVFYSHSYSIDVNDPVLGSTVIPDGIFIITDLERMKSLLFFLEVDMGTETLVSINIKTKDIQKKMLSYVKIFKDRAYKKYEDLFKVLLNGFRVLFIAESNSRAKQLSRVAGSIENADFVWLTDQELLFDNGIADEIWIKGGRSGDKLYSILGSTLSYKNPINLPN